MANQPNLKINQKAGRGQIQFYLLVDLLHEESSYVEAQTKLVRNDQLTRLQRPEYKRVNESINSLWGKFNNGCLSTLDLLKCAAKIYGPIEKDPEEDDVFE